MTKQVGFYTLAYLLLRVFSFLFFPPGTIPNELISLFTILTALTLFIRKDPRGWYIVAFEIILCGTGSIFKFLGVSVRTWLLLVSMGTYFIHHLFQKDFNFKKTSLYALLGFSVLSAVIGFINHHSLALIKSDIIPYFFLLYYFPLRELLRNEKWKNFCLTLIFSALIGQSIFIAITFATFTSQLFLLQDSFYHWYRDVAGGKITNVEFNFYRLVLNEQLLLIPLLIYFQFQAVVKKNKLAFIYIFLSLFLLALSLTRIYFVAYAIGMLIIFSRSNWKRWLTISVGSFLTFTIIFCSLFLIGSRGNSFGLEVFGLRLQSIFTPNIEDSSLSRMLILPKALEQIKSSPIYGHGLGSTVTVYSPVQKLTITTPNYDWGYLEILAELGAAGLLVWFTFLFGIFRKLKKMPAWMLSSLVVLMIINLTSPALFHVMGIIFLAFLLAKADASPVLSDVVPQTP